MPITDPCVVRLLAEGGAIEVFGHKEPEGWLFTARFTSLDIDDDGNESGRVSGIARFTDLADALPPQWITLCPRLVHPELRAWFQERYDDAVNSLPARRKQTHEQFRHHTWRALFESTAPDRWSGDDDEGAGW
jgi:hypothetical protein